MTSIFIKQQHLETYPRLSPSLLSNELRSKTVLVTGGGYGIGAAIARSFAEGGVAHVILVGRNESRLAITASVIQQNHPMTQVTHKAVDISSPTSVRNLFSALSSSIDILVNNAGFLPTPANFATADLSEWWKGFEVNVFGTALVTQAYLQHQKAQQTTSPGIVLSLNTIGAYNVMVPNLSGYGASKAALLRLNELITADVPTTEARFVSIHPGAVKTDMGAKSGLEGVFPATNEELAADFVVWTSSEEAAFLAGRFVWVNLDVDELIELKHRILSEDLLKSSITGT